MPCPFMQLHVQLGCLPNVGSPSVLLKWILVERIRNSRFDSTPQMRRARTGFHFVSLLAIEAHQLIVRRNHRRAPTSAAPHLVHRVQARITSLENIEEPSARHVFSPRPSPPLSPLPSLLSFGLFPSRRTPPRHPAWRCGAPGPRSPPRSPGPRCARRRPGTCPA